MTYRNLILLLLVAIAQLTNAQNNWTVNRFPALKHTGKPVTYDWKAIENLEEESLPRKANEAIKVIQQRAISEKNAAEYWKTLEHMSRNYYEGMYEADEVETFYWEINQQAESLPFPLSNIAHYHLYTSLNNIYFSESGRQWKMGVQNVLPADNARQQLIAYHERASLNHPEELMEWALEFCLTYNFKDSDSLSWEASAYRTQLKMYPSLFDFFAKEYLSRHTNDYGISYDWNQSLEITDPLSFSTTDSLKLSKDYNTDKNLVFPLFYALERLHTEQKRLELYTQWQITRIDFAANAYSGPDKDKLKQQALIRLENELYSLNSGAATLVAYKRALALFREALSYNWQSNTAPAENNRLALVIIKKALDRFPKADGSEQLLRLEKEIKATSVDLSVKTEIIPEHPFLLNLSYRNTPVATLKIYHVERIAQQQNTNPLKNLTLKEVYTSPMNMPTDDRYLPQEKDFLIPALPAIGEYLIVVAESEQRINEIMTIDTLAKLNGFAYKMVHNTRLIAKTKSVNGKYQLQVLDRITGKPIVGARVTYSRRIYSYDEPKTVIMNHAKTDKNGISVSNYTNEYLYTVVAEGDSISSNLYNYRYDYNNDDLSTHVEIYTDRGIYRPGQTVHYKIIAYELNDDTRKVVPGFQVRLRAEDYNGQEIASETTRTNEFGSVSGSFVIPLNGFLMGDINLAVNEDTYNHSIRVEEYKRPTFEIVFDTIKAQYALGDSVTISGQVNALAGYPVSGSKVVVDISEQRYFPWDYRGYSNEYNQITFETITDKEGRFSVRFLAENADAQQWGTNFTIEATATDPTGETQTGSTWLNIGKDRLSISAPIPATVVSLEKNNYPVEVFNNAGAQQKNLPVSWKLEKLTEGKALLEHITMAQHQSFTRDELKKELPEIAYFEEDKNINYQAAGEGSLVSGNDIEINAMVKQIAGTYRLTLTVKDNNGITSERVSNFTWINPVAKKQAESDFWAYTPQKEVQPGKEIITYLGSSRKLQTVFAEYYCGAELLKTEWIQLKGKKQLKFKVPAKAEHNVYIQLSWVRNGVHKQQTQVISVENLNRHLIVQLSTERDYLRPGKEEEWSVNIKDQRGENADAELLVSMYDASLDQFAGHYWNSNFLYEPYVSPQWFVSGNNQSAYDYGNWGQNRYYGYDDNYFYDGDMGLLRQQGRGFGAKGGLYYEMDGFTASEINMAVGNATGSAYSLTVSDQTVAEAEKAPEVKPQPVRIRDNFSETAFFYPHVRPQTDGSYKFTFTTPDALTRWRFMALGHVKDLRMGYDEALISARKEIMVMPNVPRYFREGDEVIFSAKVSNQTDQAQATTTRLRIIDPFTEQDISAQFGNLQPIIKTVDSKGTTEVSWKLLIPKGQQSLVAYHIETTTATFGDAEKRSVPVLSNRIQLTTSKAFSIAEAGTQTFTLDAAKNLPAGTEKVRLKLEVQTQPLWTTLMSLPYLMEYPYECAEQTFARYFANVLAQQIIENNPEIRRVIESWKQSDPGAFLSQLEKNPELKNIILNETPWVLDAQNERNQRARMAQLFDDNQLEQSIGSALTKLEELRAVDGGWGWFGKESSNLYITQHIVAGFGRLKELDVEVNEELITVALDHLDEWYAKQFALLKAEDKKRKAGFSEMTAHWMIARSYFRKDTNEVINYYRSCMESSWKNFGLHTQALIGLEAHNSGNKTLVSKIRASILDKATVKPQLGMYWNENRYGYFWYESQLETQSVLIEFIHASQPTGKETAELHQMQLWLLQNKRANAWETTKSTTLACHALLLDKSTTAMQTNQRVEIKLADGSEPGTVKNASGMEKVWTGTDIQPGKETVTVHTSTASPVFGAIHLTYLSDQNAVQATPSGDLRIERVFYKEVDGQKVVVQPGEILTVGTRLTVELKVVSNRSLEFVHIRAPHAYGFEPVNPMSGYRYSATSYYEVNKDASAELFVDNLIKGTSVFSYDVFVTGKGTLSVGPAIVECMYAPEFRANSAGTMVKVN